MRDIKRNMLYENLSRRKCEDIEDPSMSSQQIMKIFYSRRTSRVHIV